MPVDLTKFERLTNDLRLAGRTIKAADIGGGEVSVSFTDGSFLHAMVEDDGMGDIHLDLECDVAPYTYHSLKLITREEFDELCAAEKAANETETAERQRAEFLRLKAKFEPTP